MDKTFLRVASAAVEQSRRKVKPTRLLRDTGNSALEADLRTPPNQKGFLTNLLRLGDAVDPQDFRPELDRRGGDVHSDHH